MPMSGILISITIAAASPSVTLDSGLAPLFHAIRIVETGGEARPEKALGDGGKSLGPYQISRKYLTDSGIPGDWSRCRDGKFSETVMLAYWKRHCPDALQNRDFQTLARVHNGGPNGHQKQSTKRYWNLVSRVLDSQQQFAHADRQSSPRSNPKPVLLAATPPTGTEKNVRQRFAKSPQVVPEKHTPALTADQPAEHVGNFRSLSLHENAHAEDAARREHERRRGEQDQQRPQRRLP